jgi:hypothetical protein
MEGVKPHHPDPKGRYFNPAGPGPFLPIGFALNLQ